MGVIVSTVTSARGIVYAFSCAPTGDTMVMSGPWVWEQQVEEGKLYNFLFQDALHLIYCGHEFKFDFDSGSTDSN